MTRPSILTIVAALALGATAAAAAPTPKPAGSGASQGPKPSLTCPTPDKDQCVKKGYLDSPCGQKHLAICRPLANEDMKAYYEAKDVPKVKMLRPKMSQIPTDVEQGKYFAYDHPSLTTAGHTKYRKAYHKVGDPLRGLQGLDMSQTPPVERPEKRAAATARNFHRNPAWKNNGEKVESCPEYAYERNHGITRFIDAASWCKGDKECVFDVAYLGGKPGIANRVLTMSNGQPMEAQLGNPKSTRPKNEMFVHGAKFVRSNGLVLLGTGTGVQAGQAVTVSTALETALKAGEKFYSIGFCGNGSSTACAKPRKFENMWDWHTFLHGKIGQLSQAEHEEYTRRLAQYRNLMEQWNAAVEWEKSLLDGAPREAPAVVLPIDMRATDPFERVRIQQEYIENAHKTLQKLQTRFGKNIATKSMPQIRQQVHGARKHTPAVGVLAAPAGPVTPPPAGSQYGTHGGASHAGAVSSDMTECIKDNPEDWGLESAFKGPITCRIGELLRGEWKRKVNGHKSCLDVDNFGCDWTPEMFESTMLASIPRLDNQLADLAYCKAWDDSTTFKPAGGGNGVVDVAMVKWNLDATRVELEAIKQVIEPYYKGLTTDGKSRRLGKTWEGGDYLGNKEWFAAGYDYDVGWEVAPTRRTAADGYVCALGGNAHANTGFDAWLMDTKVPVVDGQVAARAQGAEFLYKAHLEMFDQTVFSTGRDSQGKVKWKATQTFTPDDGAGFMIQVPSFKPRFDIYVGVPISGQFWGELMFGSELSVSGDSSTTCNANNPKLQVVAGYGPTFGAYGLGQVGVGIAGIASAGIRATLTLVSLTLPTTVDMRTVVKSGKPYLRFASDLALTLATLGGRVSLYVEFFMFDEEFELFRWRGFGPTKATLMPLLSADVPMLGFDP